MKVLQPPADLFAPTLDIMENSLNYLPHSSHGGTKYDQGKPDLSIIPYVALTKEALALGFGEQKYGRYNYTAGFEVSRLVAATLRHVYAFNQGEENDPESGIHHLGHARANLGMLLHCHELGTLKDNRYRRQR